MINPLKEGKDVKKAKRGPKALISQVMKQPGTRRGKYG